jgi:hypothetical protein
VERLEVDSYRRQCLPDLVVQLAGDRAALLLLGLEQSHRQGAESLAPAAELGEQDFALALQAPALRQVADGRDGHEPDLGIDRAQVELDRELPAVCRESEDLGAPIAAEMHDARLGEVAGEAGVVRGPVRRRHEALERRPDQLPPRAAEEPLGLGVDLHEAPVRCDDEHGVGCRLQQAAESPLRLAPLGQVAGDGHHDPACADVDGGERDVDRELGAIFAQPDESEASSHPALSRCVDEARAMVAVRGAEALGNQDLHRLSVELVAVVAERGLGLRVRTDDPSVGVDGDDRVGSELEEAVEHRVALAARSRLLAQRLVRALEIRLRGEREAAGDHRNGDERGAHREQRRGGFCHARDAVCSLPDGPQREQVRDAACDEERREVASLTAKRQIRTLPRDVQDHEGNPAVRERDARVSKGVQPDEPRTPAPHLAERREIGTKEPSTRVGRGLHRSDATTTAALPARAVDGEGDPPVARYAVSRPAL